MIEGLKNIPENVKKETTSLNIQDVANFYYVGSDKEIFWHKDFITCVPPWFFTWMEWEMPDKSYSKECGWTDRSRTKGQKIGHFIASMKVKENKKIPYDYKKYVNIESKIPLENATLIIKDTEEGYDLGWVISIQTYIYNDEYHLISQREYFLKPDGSMLILNEGDTTKIFSPVILLCPWKDNIELVEGLAAETFELEKVCLLALNFVNCKNIKINENPISRQVRRYKERHNEPIYKSYTLEIKMMRDILQRVATEHNTGIHHALHLCRGHFKTYTAENPLLGKSVGTYWWDMHTRGDKDYGEIHKNYVMRNNT